MKRYKLLEIIPNLGNGGAEKLVFDICNNIDKERFDLTVLLLYDDFESKYYKILKENDIKIITLGKKVGLQINMFFKVWNVVKSIKPDVIHTHLNSNFYLLPYIIFHKKQKVLHTVHNVAYRELDSINKKIMNWLYKHRNVKAVAISNEVHKSIVNEYGLCDNKIVDINNGVDLSKYASGKIREKCDKFVAVGRFFPQKNYSLLLNAFAKAKDIENDITLTILGDGELIDEMKALATKLNISDSVSFLGNVSDVEKYLNESDCFIMSSDYEGLPLSMVEAMASGLPIVATKAGGIVDLVDSEVNGYLSDVQDEKALVENIVRMCENDNIQDFSLASVEKAKQYSLENCIEKYEKEFLEE